MFVDITLREYYFPRYPHMDAADRLRKFLADEGLTQDEFAAKHGISQAAVSAWVKRRKRPGLAMARELQRITRIKPEAWLGVDVVPLPRKEKERAA